MAVWFRSRMLLACRMTLLEHTKLQPFQPPSHLHAKLSVVQVQRCERGTACAQAAHRATIQPQRGQAGQPAHIQWLPILFVIPQLKSRPGERCPQSCQAAQLVQGGLQGQPCTWAACPHLQGCQAGQQAEGGRCLLLQVEARQVQLLEPLQASGPCHCWLLLRPINVTCILHVYCQGCELGVVASQALLLVEATAGSLCPVDAEAGEAGHGLLQHAGRIHAMNPWHVLPSRAGQSMCRLRKRLARRASQAAKDSAWR